MKLLVVLLLVVCAVEPGIVFGRFHPGGRGSEICEGSPTPGPRTQFQCKCWYRYESGPEGQTFKCAWGCGFFDFVQGKPSSCQSDADCESINWEPGCIIGDFIRRQDFEEGQGSLGVDDVIVDATKIIAFHHFQMVSDSGQSDYLISDLTYDGDRVKWINWKMDSMLVQSDALFADSTRSVSVTLSTGKTVKFYREFFWRDLTTREQAPSNYHCDDRLDFSVVLEDKVTGARLALLDSFTVHASTTRSMPVYYSSRPLIAICEYIVPPQYNGKSAIIRVVPKATGSGDYLFSRRDQWAMEFIGKASASWLADYLDANDGGWVPISYKPSLGNGTLASTPIIDVLNNKANRNIEVVLGGISEQSPVSVSVVNTTGTEVKSNFIVKDRTASQLSGDLHILEGPGLYFIVVQVSGVNVSVQKVLKDY